MTAKMKPEQIEEMFHIFQNANPEPKGELYSVNDFTFLVAVVLSAQATDAGVNKATKSLFARADTPEKMAELGEDGIKDAIKTIGQFRAKAKKVYALSLKLIEKQNAKVQSTREEIEELPGRGGKTCHGG